MLQSDWNDNLWTQESVDDWMPDNEPDNMDVEAANALFDLILNGMDLNASSSRTAVVILRERAVNRCSDIRESRVLTNNEVIDVVNDLRYEDDQTDQEMKNYIQEVISCITTGDEEADMASIETFAGTIAAQQKVTKDQARENLLALRKEYYAELAKGKTPDQAKVGLSYKIYRGGLLVI